MCSWCVLAGLVRNSVGKKVSASVDKCIKVSFVEIFSNYCRKAVFSLTGSLLLLPGPAMLAAMIMLLKDNIQI